jgi:hypothetical protein
MPDERMIKLIENFVKNIDNLNTWPTYTRGAIPKRKLKNALAYIAKGINEEDIVFYVDFTVFGSGKEGLVFTNDKLFWRDSFREPKEGTIEYDKIKSVSTQGDDSVINSSKIVPIRLGKKERRLIHELLSQIAKENRAGKKTKGKRKKEKEQIKEKPAEERLKVAQPAEEPERKLDKKTLAELSSFMTYILRHDRKNEFHVDLDKHCYAEINQLVEALHAVERWVWITREHVESVADQSVYRGKKRFAITGERIKATHSIMRKCPSIAKPPTSKPEPQEQEDLKPKITIQLSETAFTPNAWRRIEVTLKNTGTAPATEIQLEYPQEKVEIDGLSAIATLNPNDEKSLQIGLRPLHVGEVPLATRIRYKDLDNKEYKDEKTFWITVEAGVGTGVDGGVEEQKPVIKRETEFFNGFIRMKMAVTNPMSQIITDVSLDLDFDEKTLRLDRHEPEYPVKRGKVQLGTISPGTGKTVAFHLDPMTCTKAGTELNCRVDYKDAYGKPESTRMAPKKVEVVCPIFSTESDINIGMLKEFIKNLPCQDSKVFHIPAGLEKDRIIELCRETIQMHDVRHIRTLRTTDDKTCETWYYGKTKVEKSTIVINGRINEATESIEIFAATPSPESLTGLLAELGHNLTKKIKEVGKKPEQIVNVSIRDNVIQRSPNLLNLCDTNGVCSEENVIVEDNVVTRSQFAEGENNE